jgi:hypothetical protein
MLAMMSMTKPASQHFSNVQSSVAVKYIIRTGFGLDHLATLVQAAKMIIERS